MYRAYIAFVFAVLDVWLVLLDIDLFGGYLTYCLFSHSYNLHA